MSLERQEKKLRETKNFPKFPLLEFSPHFRDIVRDISSQSKINSVQQWESRGHARGAEAMFSLVFERKRGQLD